GIPITIVHGLQDELIPIEDSRVLAKTGTPGLVRLEEVNDGHRLQGLVASGRLAELVLELYKRAYPPQAPYDVGA
ncbi:MAG: lipase family protein, partial [Deltaproteobacteria bacterium]|nr:lipase family protein [Deltaproteobacteria bacterium]